ncbi:hypothetical protein [Enterobacter bugandensis]|uniref:hypothetical protein n=1 Tax=Enterobacter bugandensis TaxID=881260 RepID=UPI0020057398|nr:hypothetical protein [Enterobacter bugandensis]MCK7435914.1 hypothetical protein [Enterobacter bugandensis]
MTYRPSIETESGERVQALLNAGLFYVLKHKKSGVVVSFHHTYEEAKGKKTRKSRVELTRNLTNQTSITQWLEQNELM